MFRLSLLFVVINVVHSVQSSPFTSPLLSLSTPPAGIECTDNVCKPTSTSGIKAEVVNLEDKILNEWKAAGTETSNPNLSDSSTSSTAIASDPNSPSNSPLNSPNSASSVQPEPNVDVPITNSNSTSTPEEPAGLESQVSELEKMGFATTDCKIALKKTGYNIDEAASLLSSNEEENEEIREKIKEMEPFGWNDEAAEAAIRQCDGNITSALQMLDTEEKVMLDQFETAVSDMLDNGWEEVVARQALLAQWTLDQRKSMGTNTTIASELLAHIRPTLKKANETSTEKNETPTKKTSSTSIKDSSTPKKEKAPTPAKKEDCVFEVTAANFQKLVLESPVPVLLDIYADWCGPCKQLGPMLESAAMKSGGMFRLAKINSDKEPSLSQTLGVTGLPTVFSCVNGKLSDRFVGMLPQEQLQQYIVRAVTGYGERVQKDISDAALKEFTQKISIMAGLASFSFKKKTKLNLWVDEALALEGGMDDRGTISPSVRAALQYIDNASKDVRNEKLRTIKGTSKVFIEKIIISPSALRILDIAGFKTNDSMTAIENNGDLSLVHSNMAILNLVSQRVTQISQEVKFAKMKQSIAPIGSSTSKSLRKPNNEIKSDKSVDTKKDTKKDKKVEKLEVNVDKKMDSAMKKINSKQKIVKKVEGVTVSIRQQDGTPLKKVFKSGMKLKYALSGLLSGDSEWTQLEIRHPAPRRTITSTSPELDMTIEELQDSSSLILAYPPTSAATDSKKKKVGSGFSIFGKKKDVKEKKVVGGTHTLHSSGIFDVSKKKNNEYFGGDSTVTQAGPEDEEDEEDEEEEEEEEDEEEGKLDGEEEEEEN